MLQSTLQKMEKVPTLNEIKILQSIKISQKIDKDIQLARTPEQSTILEKKIKQILTPVNVNLTEDYLTQDKIKTQKLRSLSVMKPLSDFYIRLITQLLDLYMTRHNPQKKIQHIKGDELQKIILIIQQKKFAENIPKLIQILPKSSWQYKFRMQLLTILTTSCQSLLKYTKYQAKPAVLLAILTNNNCLNFEQNSQKIINSQQTKNLQKKLKQTIQQSPLSVDILTNKLTAEVLTKKMNHFKKQVKSHWAQVSEKDYVDVHKLQSQTENIQRLSMSIS